MRAELARLKMGAEILKKSDGVLWTRSTICRWRNNLLDRNFQPSAPNRTWTADLTYIWTDEGWLYLAVVLDLFNREIVGWSIKPRMTTDIVVEALTMAWFRRKPAPGFLDIDLVV